MSQIKNALIVILIILLCLLSGLLYFSKDRGKAAVNRIVEIKWEKGDIIRDTVDHPIPVETIIHDSILVPVPIPTDTAALFAVWQEYYLERKYALDFSNDSIGVFKVDAVVNQNKLVSATSFMQPNIRTISEKEFIYKTRKIVPWIIIGTSIDIRTNKVQFGVDLNQRYVVGISGIRTSSNWGYTLDIGMKF